MASTHTRRLCVILCATLLLLMPQAAQARLGDKLTEMKGTDFFRFFNLKETGRAAAPDKPYTRIRFRPGAGNFRELVEVVVTVDGQDRILGMQLSLKRSFVDDGMNGIFARDIAKSMLRSAVPARDEAAINSLANEIEFPKEPTAQTTPGYLVFIGQRKSYAQTLVGSRVQLENQGSGQASMLVISVSSKDLR